MATTAREHDSEYLDERTKPPFLRRVRIRGYKSIAFCDVQLHPLTILVGRNGSGKSNFLDALAFLADMLGIGIVEALKRRGGMKAILCRSIPTLTLSIEIEAGLLDPNGSTEHLAQYAVTIQPNGQGIVGHLEERLVLKNLLEDQEVGFRASQGMVSWFGQGVPADSFQGIVIPSELLFLSVLGQKPYLQLNEGLRWMRFYNFHPEAMRRLQDPLAIVSLDRDGGNFASVLATTQEWNPGGVQEMHDYLSIITPEIQSFAPVRYGEYETVRFKMRSSSPSCTLELDASNMSDGTLRALGALVAAFQIVPPYGHPSVIGIEEPETSLHPAAAHALISALDAATEHTQVLLTTHSGDLLAERDLHPSQVLVVRNRNGQTQMAPVDAASREIIRKELYTLADLQRLDQLDLDEADLVRQAQKPNGEG